MATVTETEEVSPYSYIHKSTLLVTRLTRPLLSNAQFVTFFEGNKPGTRKVVRGSDAKAAFTSIPVIDFTNIDSPSLELRQALAKELYDACSQVGFFYAKGHGIEEELFGETFEQLVRFFALDDEVKMSAHLQKNPAIK